MYDLSLLWTLAVLLLQEHFLPRFCDVLRPPHGIESATAICHYVGCFPYMASLPQLRIPAKNPPFGKWISRGWETFFLDICVHFQEAGNRSSSNLSWNQHFHESRDSPTLPVTLGWTNPTIEVMKGSRILSERHITMTWLILKEMEEFRLVLFKYPAR